MNSEQKTVVVALGGNALQRDGETSVASQQQVARETARQLISLAREGHRIAIVHGNGPQVGSIYLNEQGASQGISIPLDTCVGMSQGEIGYWLQQALQNELTQQGSNRHVATVVTQVVVDENDQAFHDPTKPIGVFYDEKIAREMAATHGFVVKEDAGRGWRRVVPSPKPLDVVEKQIVIDMLEAGHIVITAGGGGVPVVKKGIELSGVEAVIDKDFSAEKLAELIDADILLILTTVEAVSINYRQPGEQNLGAVSVEEMQSYCDAGQFAPGSMLPKVQAAMMFAELGEAKRAIITSPTEAAAAVVGEKGTHIIAR
ncbi:MAG TPA: carbamate kinase [Candidatus Chromulinivoraceae bacterium]|nr:carbamate kinase [Candidatus Chromulinivoraceae bacterium]